MRAEEQITADMAAAQASYHRLKQSGGSEAEIKVLDSQITAFRSELNAFFVHGANSCPRCHGKPHGLRKNATTVEVGCLACQGVRTRGSTRDETVARWNAGQLHR